ncbi:hypothetical protein LTS18_007912, partial [Coniosporium uncinatum]
MADSEQAIPERPKEEEEKGPSKNALKKAQKEKEKAEKKRLAQEKEAAQKAQSEGEDVSKEDYGETPMIGSAEYKKPISKDQRKTLAEVSDIADNEEVALRCVVRNARSQSAKLAFLELRDGMHSIQAVVAASEKLSRQMVKFASGINPESLVDVEALVQSPRDPVKSTTISNKELHIKKIYVVSKSESPLPIQIEDAERALPDDEKKVEEQTDAESGRPLLGLNTRLDNRVLDLRASLNHAIVEIKGGVCRLFSEYMWQNQFQQIWTPKILGSPSEGGGNVFELKYFNMAAYLAQSPQLYKQMMVSSRFKRVFEIAPVFRAENSNTARHLTEFMGLDLEMEFVDDYQEVTKFLKALVLHIFEGLRKDYSKQTELVRNVYKVEEFKIPKEVADVPHYTFAEGIEMLREDGDKEASELEDLSTPQEKRLGKLILDKTGSDFFVLDKFPLGVRPFYTMPAPEDSKLSNSYDFFMRGQEICSGAQRVHNAEFLKQRMKGMDPPLDPEGPGFKPY